MRLLSHAGDLGGPGAYGGSGSQFLLEGDKLLGTAPGLTIEFVPQRDTRFVMLSDIGALDEQPAEFRRQADGTVGFLLQGQPLGVKQ
jgi:hypothetical protein